jgi:hypothetical protein
MRRFISAALLALLAVAVAALHSAPASAHERRQVGGYVVVVGFENEPAFVEQMNGAAITVFSNDGKAISGVDKTLKVEVTTGGSSRTFDLTPVPSKQGAYVAEFIPTKAGSYVFRFFGKIESTDVNERFESGPNRFDDVVSPADLEFPAKVPTNAELATDVQSLKGAAPSTSSNASAGQAATSGAAAGQTSPGPTSADLQRALDRADSARATALIIGGVAIIVALASLGVALIGRSRGNRVGTAPPSPRPSKPSEPI